MGRSRCDYCGRTLDAMELVPLASFAVLRGRCRTCGGAIDVRHVLLEAAAAAIGMASMLALPGVPGIAAALFGWILLALALLDLDHFWLPDRLTGLLALAGAGVAAAGLAPSLAARLAGGMAGYGSLALIAALYRHMRGREGMGMGDAKLLGAIGLWMGWQALPVMLLAASGGGLLWAGAMRLAGRPLGATGALPFGALLAAAAWPLYLFDPLGVVR